MPTINDELEDIAKKGSAVISKIQRACTLVTLQVHRWHGTEAASEAAVTVVDVNVEKRTSVPKWKLIPSKWNDIFQGIEGRARSLLNWYSVRSPIRGSRFVPIDKAEELFDKLTVLKAELHAKADEFCTTTEYDAMVAALVTDLGAAAGVALKHLPGVKAIRSKFGMEWFVIPIGEPGAALTASASQYVKEAQQTLNKVILQSVEAMVREPREKLFGAVKALADQVGKDKRRVRNDSILSVKNAFEEYRNWAFLSDDQTLEHLKEVEACLEGVTPKDINSFEEVAKDLGKVLGELQTQISDESAMLDGFGKFRRSVQL